MQHHGVRPYVVALIAVAAGLAGRLALNGVIEPTVLPFIFFFPAVAVAGWSGGAGPGALATVLSALAANWFFIEPVYGFSARSRYDLVAMLTFVFSCAFIVAATEAMHISRRRLRAETDERMRVAASLAESQDILSTALTSIGDGVIATDTEGKILFLNREAERMTQVSTADAIGRPLATVLTIIDAETGAALDDPVQRVLRGGVDTGLGSHAVLVARDGTRTPIGDSAAPIQRTGGPIQGVVLVFRDVTEQRAADIAQARLAAVVKDSGDAILTKTLEGIVQSWNAAAERLFGYKPEEMIGRSITTLIPKDRLHEETEILSRLHRGQPSERLETIRLAKNGRQLHVSVSVSPIRDREGRIIGASKVVHDITDTVVAREALRKERELLATTLASIGDAVIVTDVSGRVTTLNLRAQELTGWSQAEAADQALATIFQIVNEETREPAENPVEKALRLGTIVGLANHTVLIDKNGLEWPIDDSAAPIKSADGSIVGVVLVFRDIAERRRAELALRAADRRKDEFLAVLSHELRNPLAPIRMAVALLQLGPAEAQQRELRDVIDRQTRQLTRLLDDLLDISRIASGKLSLRPERMSLVQAMTNAIETVRPHLDAANQTLDLKVPDEPIEVDGDLGRLAQVFSNLLNNASKYSDRGSRIGVVIERQGETAVVRIIDSGPGLASDEMPRIFEMFAQAGQPQARGEGGLGVGLWLAKTFVELHHGTIEAKSEGLGRGSEFVIRLPLTDSPAEHPVATADVLAPDAGRPRRILVTDDNVDAATMLAEMLRIAGHEVRVAHDGEGALRTAADFQPEVAILDIGMPGLDGYELARRFRRTFNSTVRLVALTGWGQDVDRRRATDAGFDRHLTKPVDVPELYRALRD